MISMNAVLFLLYTVVVAAVSAVGFYQIGYSTGADADFRMTIKERERLKQEREKLEQERNNLKFAQKAKTKEKCRP